MMTGKPASPCIVWFRDDLRLSDHPALHAASSTGAPVICLYVLDETSNAQLRPLGGAARWWLAQSLRALQASLTAAGSLLVLRRGPAAKVIAALAQETGAAAVFWNEIAQAPQRAIAEQVEAALHAIDVAAQSFPGDLLAAPLSIRTKEGRGLRVFTPFWRRVQSSGDPPRPLPAPKKLGPAPALASDRLETWRLEPSHPDWAGGLRQSWQPGERSAQARLDAFPWRRDDRALRAWQRGQTGYPIVDAGMRQLWHSGVMHNRVRMVVASFLVKHLLIDWRCGEKWFWDTLVDADAGSNPANWQWVAGSGADAAPYFRVFNPILQGEKFDPDGDYVRRFVPELANLPAALIHQPWEATPLELASFGVTLGKTYPTPIIDHRMARQRALDAYAKMKIAR